MPHALGSYNNYNNNCYRDCVMLCCLNSGTSFIAGFAIFSVLGFMALEQGVNIAEVAESGPGLAFIAYPRAVSMMPLAPLWASLFFLMLIFLGLDSQFVCVESLVTAMVDMYPKTFRFGRRRELLILCVSIISFFLGLIMLTEGGMYIFQLFDYYAASGMCLLFVAVFESICIGWIYGGDRFYDNIEDMIGYRPFPLIKWCWMYVTPGICASIFLFSLIKYQPLTYNKTYTYPDWGYGIGWMLALSSMICIPIGGGYKLLTTTGTFRERLQKLVTPSPDLPVPGASRAGAVQVQLSRSASDCDANGRCNGEDGAAAAAPAANAAANAAGAAGAAVAAAVAVGGGRRRRCLRRHGEPAVSGGGPGGGPGWRGPTPVPPRGQRLEWRKVPYRCMMHLYRCPTGVRYTCAGVCTSQGPRRSASHPRAAEGCCGRRRFFWEQVALFMAGS
ncbi:unnamed protein product [Lampetra fluviatilis]